MKKFYSLFVATFLSAGVAMGSNLPTMYGTVIYTKDDAVPKALYSIKPSNPVVLNKVAEDRAMYYVGGAAIVDGIYYKMAVNTTLLSYGMVSGYLYKYDATIWELISKDKVQKTQGNLISIETSQAADGTVFGEFYSSDFKRRELGVIDYKTMTRTTIGEAVRPYAAMGVTKDHRWYGIGHDGNLYQISTEDGSETLIGSTGVTIANASGSVNFQTGEIDQETGVFYWLAVDPDANCGLYTVDLTTGAATLVQQFENAIEFTDLLIPMPEAKDGAPARPTDLSAEFVNGSTSGKVVFTVPTKTFAGEDLAGNVTYSVSVGEQVLAKGSAAAGATISAQVSGAPKGMTEFVVKLTNETGDSPDGKVSVWIGLDVPVIEGTPELAITAAGDLTLSWANATQGEHGGYIGEVKYDIYQYTDNFLDDKGEVSTNAYSAKIDLGEYTNYSYVVSAKNDDYASDGYVSNSVIAGHAYEVPYYEPIQSKDRFGLFTVIDANKDGYTFTYERIKGDNYGARYSYSKTDDADDWFITPGINLKAGKKYQLSFRAGTGNNDYAENFEVAVGKQAAVEAMTQKIFENTEVCNELIPTFKKEFEVSEDGEYFVGFHAVSPADRFWFYIDSIAVDAVKDGNAPKQISDLSVVVGAKGELKADVSFTVPATTVSGAAIASVSKVVMKRNSRILKQWDNPKPGEKLQFEEKFAMSGMYGWSVTVFAGDSYSEKSDIDVYVGLDYPVAPVPVTVVDEESMVTLKWEKVGEKGVNGGYVDPTHVEYQVWNITASGTLGGLIGKVTDASELKFKFNTVSQTRVIQNWVVIPVNEIGGTQTAKFNIPLGPAYELPFEESFAGGSTTNDWWLNVGGNYRWYTCTDTSVDDDGGCASYMSIPGEYSIMNSYRIDLGSASSPTLVFSYNGEKGANVVLDVYVRDNRGVTKMVKRINFAEKTTDDWEVAEISLADFVSSKYIFLSFDARGTDAGPVSVFVDKLSITDDSGVESVVADKVTNSDIYSLQGIKLRSNTSDTTGLPAGVYIVAGQKVYVK